MRQGFAPGGLTHGGRAKPSGSVILRTPLLEVDLWEAWGTALESATASGAALEETLARDAKRLRATLRDIYDRPDVREALFLASPHFADSLGPWLEAPESERGHAIEHTLVRYFARMTSRSTPFGLFAGVSTGHLEAGPTCLALSARSSYRRHIQLDVYALVSLAESLERSPSLRNHLKYRPNSSLYHAAGTLRYVERTRDNNGCQYALVALPVTDALEQVLHAAAPGLSLSDIVHALAAADGEVSVEEATEYINELVSAQVLVSDLEPPLTGTAPLASLRNRLRGVPEATRVEQTLERVSRHLDQLNSGALLGPMGAYENIAREVQSLVQEVDATPLFHADLLKPEARVNLGSGVVRDLTRTVHLLARLTPPRTDGLVEFRRAFVRRFDREEVPLMRALDEESGVGFGGAQPSEPSLLAGLPHPPPPAPSRSFSTRDEFLSQRLDALIASRQDEWRLTEDDIGRLERLSDTEQTALPAAFSIAAMFEADSAIAMDRGDYRYLLPTTWGTSGVETLGRFSQFDPGVRQAIHAQLEKEGELHAPAVLAEIVHLPEGRVGTVSVRDTVRPFEIPYLARSGAPQSQQIGIEDLLVSVRGHRVVLRSRSLGHEVLPRLTTPHTYQRGLSLYRFLCELQQQDSRHLRWTWGVAQSRTRLPRVSYGRAVLSLAQWTVTREDLQLLTGHTVRERFERLRTLREKLGIPRHFSMLEGDQVLPVDTENVLSAESFIAHVGSKGQAVLQERFPAAGAACVRGPEGRFASQIVVPFTAMARAPLRAVRSAPKSAKARSFAPGSEWMYFKLYASAARCDEVIRELIAPVARGALRAGAIDKWFFLRYADPEPHVRVRFHGPPDKLWHEVGPLVNAGARPLLGDDRLIRVQVDTYERELERYGGDEGIDWVEQAFWIDSEAVLAILETLADEDADGRWFLAMRGAHLLWTQLGLNLEERLIASQELRDELQADVAVAPDWERTVGSKYRRHRGSVDSFLGESPTPKGASDALRRGLEALKGRAARLAPVLEALRLAAARGELTGSVTSLAKSLVHLHVNRLLRASGSRQELLLNEFLVRSYRSQLARRG